MISRPSHVIIRVIAVAAVLAGDMILAAERFHAVDDDAHHIAADRCPHGFGLAGCLPSFATHRFWRSVRLEADSSAERRRFSRRLLPITLRA